MNFKSFLFFLVIALILGAVAALTFMDVPVRQQEVVKDVKYENAAP